MHDVSLYSSRGFAYLLGKLLLVASLSCHDQRKQRSLRIFHIVYWIIYQIIYCRILILQKLTCESELIVIVLIEIVLAQPEHCVSCMIRSDASAQVPARAVYMSSLVAQALCMRVSISGVPGK